MSFETASTHAQDALTDAMSNGALMAVQFENTTIRNAAIAAGFVGAGILIRRWRDMSAAGKSIEMPDPSMDTLAKKTHFRQMLGYTATGLVAFSSLTAGILHEAGPYHEKAEGRVGSVAAIISAGWDAYAQDVTEEDGSKTTRLEASVNGINLLEGISDDVKISFIAAGAEPQQLGTSQDRNTTVDNFNGYVADHSNKSESNIEDAINIAGATEADKILIIGGSVQEAAGQLKGEAEEGNSHVSVIALGQSGSTVNFLGSDRQAPHDHAGNTHIVGSEDAYTATSVPEFQQVVSEIIADQYVESERIEDERFEDVRNLTAGLLVAGVAFKRVLGVLKPRGSRKKRR